METLRIKKGFPEPKAKLIENEDMAIIQYAEMPKKPLRDEFIGDYLVAHVDESDEIIAMTITNVTAFLERSREKEYFKQTDRESVEKILKNSRELLRILPGEILYQIRICNLPLPPAHRKEP